MSSLKFPIKFYLLLLVLYFLFHLKKVVECKCIKTKSKYPQGEEDENEIKCSKIESIKELISDLENIVNISKLNVSNNNISVLLTDSFPLPKLIKLDLSKNKIAHIEKGAFLSLDKLKTLILTHNKLKTLSREMFEGLISLEILDVSNSNISVLYSQSFPLPKLIKLDLSKNKIAHIEKGVFSSLDKLKTLILTHNKLKTLSREMFEGLISLEILKLNQNLIATIPYGLFDDLMLLTKLNIANNPLVCDCNLLWILQRTKINFTQVAKCVEPALYRNFSIEEVYKRISGSCESTYSLLSLTPHKPQIVVSGDAIRLRCKISDFGPANDSLKAPVFWSFNDVNTIVDNSEHIEITRSFSEDYKFQYSEFLIKKASDVHTGEWICNYRWKQLNQSVGLKIIVLSEKTNYCHTIVTNDNKGIYAWPETPSFTTVLLPCKADEENSTDRSFASYSCNDDGHWIDYNTTNCPYVSSVTRILHQFSKMNLTHHKASLIESALRLRNFTGENLMKINDSADLAYILSTVENYLTYLSTENKLGPLLMEIMGKVLKIPSTLLREAQRQYEICSRFLRCIETISRYTPSFEFQNSDFSLKEFHISSETFAGLTCTWFKQSDSFSSNCSMTNRTTYKSSNLEISVQIPQNLFYQSDMETIRPSVQILLVGTFNDNALFVEKVNNTKYSILPPVIVANLVGVKSGKLDDPVFIILRNYYNGLNTQLAWWDNDVGMWIKEGCHAISTHGHNSLLIFRCYKTGYFALLTDRTIRIFQDDKDNELSLSFRYQILSIFTYIATFVSVTCLLFLMLIYVIFYSRIQMSRKMKHSKINMWLSTSLFSLIFCLGIWQIDNDNVCQIIGLMIHYFALSTFFWMAVTIKTLYKCVQKNRPSMTTPSEDIPGVGADVIIRKRILGIYLVGWGISFILCGISGAVNLQGYAGKDYCFLIPGPALSTVLIPASLVLFYLLIMCLLVNCATGSVESNPQLSVGTQAIDLELLDTGRMSLTQEHSSIRSITTPSSQAEDLHHSPSSQLKIFVIFLILYTLLITSAACSIMLPSDLTSFLSSSSADSSYDKHWYSFVYLIASVLISITEFGAYYIHRTDVRIAVCEAVRQRRKNKSRSDQSGLIADAAMNKLLDNGAGSYGGFYCRSSSAALLPPPPSSGNGAILGNVAPVECVVGKSDFAKPINSKVNLLKLQSQRQYTRTDMNPDNFYNPHQSIAAKKFFRRQRRKRNTLIARKCRSGGSSPISTCRMFDPTSSSAPKINHLHDTQRSNNKFAPINAVVDEAQKEKALKKIDNVLLSETSFIIPEYEEVAAEHRQMIEKQQMRPTKYSIDDDSTKYDEVYNGASAGRCLTREQMCGTSDRDWCSYDTASDVNSEPTYNYAFIDKGKVDGYNSCQSILSDRSSCTSHLYATVAPDEDVNPVIARCRNFEYVRVPSQYGNANVTFPPTQTRSNRVFNTGPNSLFSENRRRKKRDILGNEESIRFHRTTKDVASPNDEHKVETCV